MYNIACVAGEGKGKKRGCLLPSQNSRAPFDPLILRPATQAMYRWMDGWMDDLY